MHSNAKAGHGSYCYEESNLLTCEYIKILLTIDVPQSD